jgi:hypothetical protein
LAWSDQTRDIGVTIDSNLKFDKHIANIVQIASSGAFLILKSFVTRDQQILAKAFTTYVRPLLEYCTPVWSPLLILKNLFIWWKMFSVDLQSVSMA